MRRARLVIATSTAALMVATTAGTAFAQGDAQDELTWRRIPLPGMATDTTIVDIASDGISAVAVAVEYGKKGNRATLWRSADGHSGWSPLDQPAVKVGDNVALSHGDDGWQFAGPAQPWTSTDGVEWTPSSIEVDASRAPTIIGEHMYRFAPEGWQQAPLGTETWTTVDELAGLDVVAPTSSGGGFAIGDGATASSADGVTWTRSDQSDVELGSMFNALTALEDGSVVATGAAPRFDGKLITAMWLGEPAGVFEPATLEASAELYAGASDVYNKRRLAIPTSFTKIKQARKAVARRAANARTMAADLAAWDWPAEASDEAAEFVAILDALAMKWEQMAKAKDWKAMTKLDKQVTKLSPWSTSGAYEIRDVLGLPITKELERAYEAQR